MHGMGSDDGEPHWLRGGALHAGDDGVVVPGEAEEAPNGEAARRRAAAVATAVGDVGVRAFSRTRDPDTDNFAEGVALATFGAVDLTALQG